MTCSVLLPFADGNSDGAIVFTRGQLAPYEHVRAFDQPVGELGEALAECDNVVPLGLFFPLIVLILPRLLRGDGELRDWRSVWHIFGFCVRAAKTDNCKLIQVHVNFPLSALCLGTLFRRVAATPKPSDCFVQGNKISFPCFSKPERALEDEIVLVVPEESRRSAGAGRRVYARSGAKQRAERGIPMDRDSAIQSWFSLNA
jgi:hypothetical protein